MRAVQLGRLIWVLIVCKCLKGILICCVLCVWNCVHLLGLGKWFLGVNMEVNRFWLRNFIKECDILIALLKRTSWELTIVPCYRWLLQIVIIQASQEAFFFHLENGDIFLTFLWKVWSQHKRFWYLYRDANHSDFCGIIPIFQGRFLYYDFGHQSSGKITISIWYQGVSPTATPIYLITGIKIK